MITYQLSSEHLPFFPIPISDIIYRPLTCIEGCWLTDRLSLFVDSQKFTLAFSALCQSWLLWLAFSALCQSWLLWLPTDELSSEYWTACQRCAVCNWSSIHCLLFAFSWPQQEVNKPPLGTLTSLSNILNVRWCLLMLLSPSSVFLVVYIWVMRSVIACMSGCPPPLVWPNWPSSIPEYPCRTNLINCSPNQTDY